jgi:hypothetical protein
MSAGNPRLTDAAAQFGRCEDDYETFEDNLPETAELYSRFPPARVIYLMGARKRRIGIPRQTSARRSGSKKRQTDPEIGADFDGRMAGRAAWESDV